MSMKTSLLPINSSIRIQLQAVPDYIEIRRDLVTGLALQIEKAKVFGNGLVEKHLKRLAISIGAAENPTTQLILTEQMDRIL